MGKNKKKVTHTKKEEEQILQLMEAVRFEYSLLLVYSL